jgi:ophiobolin F synthase
VEYSKQKGFCEDLDEGKFSYPVVHCFQADQGSQDLILGMFRQRQTAAAGAPLAVESKLQILGCMEKAGTFDATWKLLRQLEEEAEKEVEVLESQTTVPNPMMRLLLKTLKVPQRKGGYAV